MKQNYMFCNICQYNTGYFIISTKKGIQRNAQNIELISKNSQIPNFVILLYFSGGIKSHYEMVYNQ